MHATLGHWQLNGRAFHNDPGGFSLREKEPQLSAAQQNTVLTLHTLLGNLLFTSDDWHQYTPEQTAELEGALAWRGSRIRSVREVENEVYAIYFEWENVGYGAICNLTENVALLGPKEAPP